MDVLISVLITGIVVRGLHFIATASPGIKGRAGIIMRYPVPTVGVAALFSIGAGLAFLVLSQLPQNRAASVRWRGGVAFAIVIVPATAFLCEALRRRILLTKRAIVSVGRSGHQGKIIWDDVRSIRYQSLLGCFVVEGPNGKRILVSHLLSGQREFARTVADAVSSEKRVGAKLELDRLLR